MKSDQRVDSIVDGILDYLKDQEALDLLTDVAEELTQRSWSVVDPNLAIIFSKIKLSESQLDEIKKSLSSYLGRPIRLKTRLDKDIIAGFKIEVAGTIIDATVNKKLNELKNKVIYD